MTETIKLTKEDIHIVLTVGGYAVKFRSLEGLDIIWNEKQAKELKQQILENQEIVKKLESRINEVKCQLESCNERIYFADSKTDAQYFEHLKYRLETESKIYSTVLHINEILGDNK